MEDQLRILRSSQDPRKLGESQSSLRTKMLEENPEDIPEMIDDDMLDLGEISFGKMVGYSCFCSVTHTNYTTDFLFQVLQTGPRRLPCKGLW